MDAIHEPLTWLIDKVDTLLREEDFEDLQRSFLLNISQEARAFQSLILTLFDIEDATERQMLSFDGRSQLNNILGYTEELLEEVEGELNEKQRESLLDIRNCSREILARLEDLLK